MEILKGHPANVKFVVPPDLVSANFQVFKNNVQIGSSSNAVVSNGVATVTIPYAAVVDDGEIKIVLSFAYQSINYTPEKKITVATPYLDIYEVKAILETDNDEEAAAAEAGARHIVNSHCGQTFGKFIGVRSVTGNDDTNLRMPQRLISFAKINDNAYWNTMLALRGGGWFLAVRSIGVPSIRADFDGWHYDPNSGVIAGPYSKAYGRFVKNQEYEIDGVWGWESVPDRVREAMKLLINDYACGDSLYRDRFLTSMTAADWRIQFHEAAFSNTGNVRANQLLADFVLRRGWVVI